MGRWTPCKRRVFINKLRRLGFEPPEPGGRHFYMRYGTHTLPIPNNSEYAVPQLKMLIREVESILEKEISLDEWEKL
ncbi:MAG: type II toxin-antitoxin system HicA family toxin [Euryarchaeota archaeon]|nr:type II toxin-antitoxin system HicA family toxin [Euryarchaeota archaeon]